MEAKKSLGQNFLTSQGALRKILSASQLSGEEIVLEIGPGKGILTEQLLSAAKKVIAVEKDNRLIPLLTEKFEAELQKGSFLLHEGDILDIDLENIGLFDHAFTVVANIPYYITGELLRRLLSGKIQPNRAILLLQKEVVERIARSKKESLLSLSIKAYGKPTYVATVPRGSFSPAPTVDSAILSIESISRDFFDTISQERFFEVIKLGFGQKRKQLIGNLRSFAPREELESVFLSLNLPLTVRAEDLQLGSWKTLILALDANKIS